MKANRKTVPLITQNVTIVSIENSIVLALIKVIKKSRKKTARHVKWTVSIYFDDKNENNFFLFY